MIAVWRRAVVGLVAAFAAACCPFHFYERSARILPTPSLAEVASACEAAELQIQERFDEPPQQLWVALPDQRDAWIRIEDAVVVLLGGWGHHPTHAECRELDAVFAEIVERLAAAGLRLPFAPAEIVPIVRCERCAAGGGR